MGALLTATAVVVGGGGGGGNIFFSFAVDDCNVDDGVSPECENSKLCDEDDFA
jgi:hypothetical protein